MLQRDTVIKQIKAGLKNKTGKDWSVTGGKGTAYGYIQIKPLKSVVYTQDDYNTLNKIFPYSSLNFASIPYQEWEAVVELLHQ